MFTPTLSGEAVFFMMSGEIVSFNEQQGAIFWDTPCLEDVEPYVGLPFSQAWCADGENPEVDYARDLVEDPTFTEALAAIEVCKARKNTAQRNGHKEG